MKLEVDDMFKVAYGLLDSVPEAAEAVVKDVEEQSGMTLPTELTKGLLACGMVLLMTVMQKRIEIANSKKDEN